MLDSIRFCKHVSHRPGLHSVHGLKWLSRWSAVALCAGTVIIGFSSAQAQDAWVGRVTIGDIVRQELLNVLDAQQKATANKAEFNARIARARMAFLETAQTPKTRAKAEADFARLLLEKDLYFFTMYLNEGFSDRSMSVVRGLEAMTGGALDKGIPSDGRAAFETWVRGVRASLGAPRDGQMAMAALQRDRLLQALQANEPLYQEYKRLRDHQEINGGVGDEQRAQAAVAKEVRDAIMPDGGVRLFQKELQPPSSWNFYGPIEGEMYAWLVNVRKNGQQTLACTYGPSQNSQGKKAYGSYSFWYDKVPSDIEAVLSRDHKRALRFLGARAITECPDSDKAALTLRQRLMAEHPLAGTAPPKNTLQQQNPALAQTPPDPQSSAVSAAEERRQARSRMRAEAAK